MEDLKKSERVVQVLLKLLNQPEKAFSISELLTALGLSKSDNERRNLQRDMNLLTSLPGELIVSEGQNTRKKYRTGLNVLDKLVLPDFESVMLQFVFLQNIADIYPGTAELIEKLVEKIQGNLPKAQQEKLRNAYKDIGSRVFFVGGYKKIDDDAGEKLRTILQAIRTHREIWTQYKPSDGESKQSNRIPVGIVLFQGDIYIACTRRDNPRAVYTIKLNRIEAIKPTTTFFVEDSETKKILKSKVEDFSLFNNHENDVKRIHLTFPCDKRAYVEEYPYHQSMRTVERKGVLHVTMDVNITLQLRQWLLFHTENGVEIVEPKSLRKDLLKIGQNLVEKYNKRANLQKFSRTLKMSKNVKNNNVHFKGQKALSGNAGR